MRQTQEHGRAFNQIVHQIKNKFLQGADLNEVFTLFPDISEETIEDIYADLSAELQELGLA